MSFSDALKCRGRCSWVVCKCYLTSHERTEHPWISVCTGDQDAVPGPISCGERENNFSERPAEIFAAALFEE